MGGPEGTGDRVANPASRELQIFETGARGGWRLVGELSSANVDTLGAALASDPEAPSDVTLDLAGVTFVDTMGLHLIAQAAIERDGRGRVILESAKPWVRRVLVLAGIDAIPNVELRHGSP